MEALRCCVVGHWCEFLYHFFDLYQLKKWVVEGWGLGGKIHLVLLRGALILFNFQLFIDAERTLPSECRLFKGKLVLLDRWSPMAGCYRNDVHANEVWV